MKGYQIAYLLVAGIAATPLSSRAAEPAGYTAPTCTLSESQVPKITKQNGHEVLRSLWEETWQPFIACVESGKAEWVDTAVALHAFSDAGATDEINAALGEALGNNPTKALEEVVSPASTIGVDTLCSGPDVDDPRFNSYALSMAEITRRQAALERVASPALKTSVETCRASLENSKKDVAAFYQKRPSPN